jgi:hypothetical protein
MRVVNVHVVHMYMVGLKDVFISSGEHIKVSAKKVEKYL